MEIIKTISLKKVYETGDMEVRALDGVDLSIQEGEFLSIVGSSGSGKSTLLNMLGGLDYPTNGFVSIRGENLSDMSEEELTVFRRRNIGFVFQNYNLVPSLNVYENIVLPLKLDESNIDEAFIEDIMSALGIAAKVSQMPTTLSGGQQQRVAIARALSTRPAIILADEPTGNLDSKTSRSVIALMRTMAEKYHQTMAIVTHNEEIAKMADRMIRIEDGRIC
jgi:putative ABC transport system ATP-binding protein